MRIAFIGLGLLAAVAQAPAQESGFSCLANHPVELARHLAERPNAAQHALQAKAAMEAGAGAFTRGGGQAYVIPVVFHVIHDFGPENISDQQVLDAVRILNEDFNRLNPDWSTVRPEFLDIVADVGIEFRLARRDPEGNCTNGITRTASIRTYDGDYDMTQLIQWPRDRYMNVWVAASASGAAGYTYYPMWLDGWPEADGIVIKHDYVGSVGTGSPGRSRALTHEVGHWLNLKHTWGDSNEPGLPENCDFDDDVDDTPLTRGWTSCLLNGNSCGSGPDNVQNYMEYAYCSRMFTMGQGDRMLAALNSDVAERSALWQPENLDLTGVSGPGQVCQVRFTADRRTICAGETIQFQDQSFWGITTRYWSFPGGQPANSDAETPSVTYTEPGLYPVSLEASDGTNGITGTEPVFIRVLPSPGQPVPWLEGFESTLALPDERWAITDRQGDGGFVLSQAAAFTGSRSARLPNAITMSGNVDELLSETFDLSGSAGAIVTFRYAFAKRFPTNDDALFVWVSADCGATWVLRKVMRASNALLTAGVINGPFTPSGPDQWRLAEITNIGPTLCTSSFRLRFEFVSDGGNDLFIDDINIVAGQVGMRDQATEAQGLAAAWDASSGDAWASFAPVQPGPVRIEVQDAAGRRIAGLQAVAQSGGLQRMALGLRQAAPGTYIVRLVTETGTQAVRFIVP